MKLTKNEYNILSHLIEDLPTEYPYIADYVEEDEKHALSLLKKLLTLKPEDYDNYQNTKYSVAEKLVPWG
jgi:hypothetical protein